MWYMYTMEYFSAVKKKKKKNEIMPFCSNIDDLEIIVKWGKSKTNIIWYYLYVESNKKWYKRT